MPFILRRLLLKIRLAELVDLGQLEDCNIWFKFVSRLFTAETVFYRSNVFEQKDYYNFLYEK